MQMSDRPMKNTLLIIGPPPTPNGDLHIGHIAGPYMSADVMRRWVRMNGAEALFVTGTDDAQTYVDSSARKRQVSPDVLTRQSTEAIKTSLKASMIDVDGFAPYDAEYEKAVRAFLDPLYKAGKFKLARRNLPYDAKHDQFLVEGLIEGECPNCLAPSRGALCEACGMPLRCEDLRQPKSTSDTDADITFRCTEILVFPLESVRAELTAYYNEARLAALRPESARIIRQVLAGPLPEFPVTYPLKRGLFACYPDTPGQVFNAWAEGMPASMACTAAAFNGDYATGMQFWRRDDVDIVYFLGLDNVYFWGIAHLGLLLAHEGEYRLPQAYYSNHFYELDDRKISTSQGHVVVMEELLANYSLQAIRFYLCWTSPEVTERSFSRHALETIAQDRLIAPWNTILDATEGVPVGAADRQSTANISLMVAEFERALSTTSFSTAAAVRALAKHLDRLARAAREQEAEAEAGSVKREFVALAKLADPILKLAHDADALRRADWQPPRLALAASPPIQCEVRRLAS